MYTADDLCVLFQITPETLHNWEISGKIPPALKIGKTKRWKKDVIDNWIEAGCPGQETPR